MYLSSMFLMYYFMHFADNDEARRIRVYFDHLAEAVTRHCRREISMAGWRGDSWTNCAHHR